MVPDTVMQVLDGERCRLSYWILLIILDQGSHTWQSNASPPVPRMHNNDMCRPHVHSTLTCSYLTCKNLIWQCQTVCQSNDEKCCFQSDLTVLNSEYHLGNDANLDRAKRGLSFDWKSGILSVYLSLCLTITAARFYRLSWNLEST